MSSIFCSGVIYFYALPGRYPGLPNESFKVPSILWYNQDGTLHSAGVKAHKAETEGEDDDDDTLIRVEWFVGSVSSSNYSA